VSSSEGRIRAIQLDGTGLIRVKRWFAFSVGKVRIKVQAGARVVRVRIRNLKK
jgi:hypothetical protein